MAQRTRPEAKGYLMAKQRVVTVECDNCGDTDLPDPDINKRDPLPVDWVYLTMSSDHGYMFELELCKRCSSGVLKALARRRKD